MITVTQSDGVEVFLNEDQILKIEQQNFQTVIYLITDRKLIVKEEATDLISRIKKYKYDTFRGNFEVTKHEE
jgi:uncharacterized protein YlzI (FlbEa/FlbD family)